MSEPKLPDIRLNTEEEERAIGRAIASDPDSTLSTPPLSARQRPWHRRDGGRRVFEIALDADIVAALKIPHGSDWETRLNATLRKALGL